jgi:two-component sensor histidine kinase
VQSDETRSHLYDAHQRVMSVAALQQQLASSSVSDVKLRPYFTALCDSIGASTRPSEAARPFRGWPIWCRAISSRPYLA